MAGSNDCVEWIINFSRKQDSEQMLQNFERIEMKCRPRPRAMADCACVGALRNNKLRPGCVCGIDLTQARTLDKLASGFALCAEAKPWWQRESPLRWWQREFPLLVAPS